MIRQSTLTLSTQNLLTIAQLLVLGEMGMYFFLESGGKGHSFV